jgi:hypothetical protein
MDRRLELHDELLSIFKKNVYYQPPESIKLSYPCFIYSLSNGQKFSADNSLYLFNRQYQGMYITTDPDHGLIETVLQHFRYASYDRRFVSDNLYHDSFTIYY